MPTEENPADHSNHRLTAKRFSSLKMWWKGPQLLSNGHLTNPKQPEILQSTEENKEQVRSRISIQGSGTIPETLGRKATHSMIKTLNLTNYSLLNAAEVRTKQ